MWTIDKWTNLIRKTHPREPIQLVLIDKSNSGSDQVVTEAMMQEKSDKEKFEGVIVINCKEMNKEKVCEVVNGIRKNIYAKATATQL